MLAILVILAIIGVSLTYRILRSLTRLEHLLAAHRTERVAFTDAELDEQLEFIEEAAEAAILAGDAWTSAVEGTALSAEWTDARRLAEHARYAAKESDRASERYGLMVQANAKVRSGAGTIPDARASVSRNYSDATHDDLMEHLANLKALTNRHDAQEEATLSKTLILKVISEPTPDARVGGASALDRGR